MQKRASGAILILAVFLLAGCPDKNTRLQNSRQDLMERVNEYNELFQWRDFDKAKGYVVQEERARFIAFTRPLEHGFSMENFTVDSVEVAPSGERATVVVTRSFVMMPSVILQTQDFTQEWVRIDGVWYLAGPPF